MSVAVSCKSTLRSFNRDIEFKGGKKGEGKKHAQGPPKKKESLPLAENAGEASVSDFEKKTIPAVSLAPFLGETNWKKGEKRERKTMYRLKKPARFSCLARQRGGKKKKKKEGDPDSNTSWEKKKPTPAHHCGISVPSKGRRGRGKGKGKPAAQHPLNHPEKKKRKRSPSPPFIFARERG